MKLDIFIKQTKLETSILVELDGVKQFSMRKILGTFPDDVVKALISLLIDVTIYNPIKHINIYCANRGLFLFLNKKGKDSNLVYLDYLLGGYDSVIINKKVNEIDYKFDDFMISIGSYKQESAILEETLDSTIFHKKYAMPSNETSYHLWIAQLLQMFLKKKRVTFVNNDMYVDVLDNTYCIENMGYQLSFDKLRTQNTTTEELNQLGFTLGSNDITAFSSTIDNVQITNQYAKSSKIIEPCEVTKDIVIPLNDFLRLLSRVNTSKADDIPIIGELSKEQEEEQETEPVEEEKSSYYLNSELGIKINNQTFSVDDYINIKDYFFDTTPEGINYKEEWDKDTKVTLCYASYIDTTGKFTAMSINNIVYKLAADCDFEFLGFSAGQSIEEINRILGIKLNSKDKKDFKPLRDDIVITKTGNNFIRFTVGDYKVRFGFDKSKALSSMTIEKERDYKKYDND